MKKFIIGLSKVFPWIYTIAGVVFVIDNPPRTSLYDENTPLAIALLIGVVLSGFLLYGLSYVVEAACLYLEKNKQNTKEID